MRQKQMDSALQTDRNPSLADAARVGGVWQTDGSRHTVGQRMTGDDGHQGKLLASPQELK